MMLLLWRRAVSWSALHPGKQRVHARWLTE